MDENIKRVEKLVHATNSALAQMKFSLMFDDMVEGGKSRRTKKADNVHTVETFLDGDELTQCQNEFKSEADDMLAKMEKMFGTSELNRKNSKALERIKEINKKMSHLRLEQSRPVETEQSRQKLLSLVSEEKFSPGMTSSKGSVGSKHGVVAFREKNSPENSQKPASKTPMKSQLELKSKILETQEIVDRGFQTARELAAKVENMTKCEKKTPSTVKTVSDINLKSLERKTESSETIKSVSCRKHSEKRKKAAPVVMNTLTIDVKRKEVQQCVRSNLQLQRLPSLHIRGGLICQKVHNLEIPACEEDVSVKANTGVSFLSHEHLEKEKMDKIIEKLQWENNCCGERTTGNYVECFNCGKLIRVRETRRDPRTVDEILQKCDFNVFDPRIDEFVERQGAVDVILPEKPQSPVPAEIRSKNVGVMVKTIEEAPKCRRFSLRDLSDQLCRKYREEADNLEDNHLKLDSILQNLFRKVDESREVFEDCHLFRNSSKVVALTATKPVLVNLVENSSQSEKKYKKLDKKDVKNRNKSRTKEKKRNENNVQVIKHPEVLEKTSVTSTNIWDSDQPEAAVRQRSIEKTLIMASILSETAKAQDRVFKKDEKPNVTSSTSSQMDSEKDDKSSLASLKNQSKAIFKKDDTERKPPPSETMSEKSENNYESDFETMSSDPEDEEPEMIPCVKKLSTISEVDSELERKPSDEQATSKMDDTSLKEKENSVTPGEKAVTPPKTTEPTPKSTPTELVTSLKDILSALQDQFARTESLTEKLTENTKMEKPELGVGAPSLWKMPSADKLVENLQSARKAPRSPFSLVVGEKPISASGQSDSSEDVSEMGGSSLGEIVVSDRKRDESGDSSISEISFLNLESGKNVEFG